MINAPMPSIEDPKVQEEVRKALLNMAAQINTELDALRAQIQALTP